MAKIACAGSRYLQKSVQSSTIMSNIYCTLCDTPHESSRNALVYWNEIDSGESWKDVIAAMILITKQPVFQSSSKARILMAVAIGRVYNHVSDPTYLNLDNCELGQWLLGSMCRSLRELKLAST